MTGLDPTIPTSRQIGPDYPLVLQDCRALFVGVLTAYLIYQAFEGRDAEGQPLTDPVVTRSSQPQIWPISGGSLSRTSTMTSIPKFGLVAS